MGDSGQQRRPREDWISGRVAITAHALDRARERLAKKFQGARFDRVAKMIERAVRHPEGEVEPHDEIQDRAFQVAVPFIDHDEGRPMGHLIVGKDRTRAGIVVMTWLDPGQIQEWRDRRYRMNFVFGGLPRWWEAFQTNPDEPGHQGRD